MRVIVLALVGSALVTGQRNKWFDRFFKDVPAWEIIWRFVGLSLLLLMIVAIAGGLPGWVFGGSLILLLAVLAGWVVGKFNDYFNS